MLNIGVRKNAGLVTERRDGNRIRYQYQPAEDRLATCIGRFLSVACPEQIVLRHTKRRPEARSEGSCSNHVCPASSNDGF